MRGFLMELHTGHPVISVMKALARRSWKRLVLFHFEWRQQVVITFVVMLIKCGKHVVVTLETVVRMSKPRKLLFLRRWYLRVVKFFLMWLRIRR